MGEKDGSYLSSLGGRILAGKKAREDADKNRRRLKAAALVSREFGAQRIMDEDIKKLLVRLVYEADSYISSALETPDAFYEPVVLDALDNARSALNAWKKSENDAAALKFIGAGGNTGGIVIPGGKAQEDGDAETRLRTLGILRESIRVFAVQNGIRISGDPDAALAALADYGPFTPIEEMHR